MVARNDITGDLIKTKVVVDDKFEKGFGAIDFSVKLEETKTTPDKPVESVQLEFDFDEKRIDVIGQNGNTADHYKK